MTAALDTKHNEFVTQAMIEIGPGLIAQGNVSQQLVAAGSLLTGMIGLIANLEGMPLRAAEAYLRAVANGAVKRLPEIIQQRAAVPIPIYRARDGEP